MHRNCDAAGCQLVSLRWSSPASRRPKSKIDESKIAICGVSGDVTLVPEESTANQGALINVLTKYVDQQQPPFSTSSRTGRRRCAVSRRRRDAIEKPMAEAISEALIRDVQEQLAALRLRLPGLEGKDNKRERTRVNKDIYRLENGEDYAEALRSRLTCERAVAAVAADELARVDALAQAAAVADAAAEAKARLAATGQLSEVAERNFRQQVESLFDEYADHFEDALCNGLQYKTPELMTQRLLERPQRSEGDIAEHVLSRLDAVDFGCGTGLMGVQLRSSCKGRLLGCDLSRLMLREASRKYAGVYDKLSHGDAVSFLRKLPAASSDLVVGADVCVYMRSLVDLIEAAEAALSVGGVLAFSTEVCRLEEIEGGLPPTGCGYIERSSERIAHSPEYIAWLVSALSCRLELVTLDEMDLRMDGANMIRGQIAVMTKRAS